MLDVKRASYNTPRPLASFLMHPQIYLSHASPGIPQHPDACRNAPNVHKVELLPNEEAWHGASLSLIIEGNWSTYKSKIIK